MKIELISGTSEYDIVERVNEFIANHHVTDIQFRVNGENQVRTVYSVMIIYRE